MIRDYKFKRTEWTLRKKRRLGSGVIAKVLGLVLLGGAGYGGYLWLTSGDNGRDTAMPAEADAQGDSGVIELKLPPNPSAAATINADKP
ncbi:hypothetical protein [Thiorhodococcus minor]|uniref:Uncharacterized protein n=1 Tax=Thiorhodococcus minor TaxID=57489 RepID=A0A6M0K525_9GAMM|nr:hypothetical protein [Thiorhodococcus minor]NEV64529.1 hypothetical protein [Thiorhodococcus minor]